MTTTTTTMTIISVASNRKNLISSQHTNTLYGGLEPKGKKAIPISYSVFFQVAMCVFPTVRSQIRSFRAASSVGKGSLGGGDTRSTLSSFFVFPDAPKIDWRQRLGIDTVSRFEHYPSLPLKRVTLRMLIL